MDPLTLDRVLALRPDLRMEVLDRCHVVLLGERNRFVLSGPRTAAVLALVDGRRTVDDILRAAAGQVSEPEVFYTLEQLCAGGYLLPAVPDLSPESAAFWQGMGVDVRSAQQALRRTPVSVRAIGNAVGRSWMAEALVQAGVSVDDAGEARVVVTDDYLAPELSRMHAEAAQRGAPWCPVKLVGLMPLIGPVLQPDAGPCWDCVAHWIRSNRPVEEFLRRSRNDARPPTPPAASLEATLRIACGLASLVVARALSRSDTTTSPHAQLFALDVASLDLTRHSVVKRPQCSTCGDPGRMRATGECPIELQPIEKAYRDDGGYRRETPRQTFARYQHLISPITGAVTHVVPMAGRDTDLRAVYASGYLACPRQGMPQRNIFDRLCAGKGRTKEQARTSALCEALERYSGVYQGDEARVRTSLGQLLPAAVPPDKLLGYSETQYRERERYNARAPDRSRWVPEPFDPSAVIDWTPGWSLSHNERRYVPLSYCYAEAPAESGVDYCPTSGNGVAAGNCLEEAILQGLLELIERDAGGIWWYSRARRPAWDLESFDEPFFGALRDDYERLGWELWALDLTHDVGVPVCAALARNAKANRFAIGFGCHLDARLCVQRALTELNQLFEPAGARRAPWEEDRLPSCDFLFPDPGAPSTRAGARPKLGGADLRADIQACIERIGEDGLEVIVVDKTRPDIGLSVAQVIVPGLCHFWPRFGPARLYRVPRELGWIRKPLVECELNPSALFL